MVHDSSIAYAYKGYDSLADPPVPARIDVPAQISCFPSAAYHRIDGDSHLCWGVWGWGVAARESTGAMMVLTRGVWCIIRLHRAALCVAVVGEVVARRVTRAEGAAGFLARHVRYVFDCVTDVLLSGAERATSTRAHDTRCARFGAWYALASNVTCTALRS